MENCLQRAQTEKVHNRDLKDTETKICVESVVISNAKHLGLGLGKLDEAKTGCFATTVLSL